MTTTMKFIATAIAGVIVGLLLSTSGVSLGGVYSQVNQNFREGIKVGTADQFVIASTGAVTSSGAFSLSGALGITGITSVAEFSQGGGIATLTDANGGVYTLTESELLNNSVLKFAASGAGQEVIALTFPATSTMTTLLPNAGDMRTWFYDSTALAAATTTTLTLGVGIDLIGVTTNDDLIDGGELAEITCFRQADTDVTCLTSELLNTD